jgi:hypothetical protein
VLGDDPGSAVLTLTSLGMAERSRPHGHDASPIIALWKDPSRGVREIRLDPGAYGVILTVCMSRSPRRSADSRWPVANGTLAMKSPSTRLSRRTPAQNSGDYRQGVAEVLARAPGGAPSLLAEARSGAAWRDVLGLAEPSARLSNAIDAMSKVVMTAGVDDSLPTFESVLSAASAHRQDESGLDATVRHVLRAMLEERQTRHGARRTARTRGTTEIGQPCPSTRPVISPAR